MNIRDLQMLKEIAILGGIDSEIDVKTSELARRMGCAQQTASRMVLNLMSLGLIERGPKAKGYTLRLTQDGVDLLFKEYLDYIRIFEVREKLVFWGMVSSGFGEGHYFVQRKGYQDQIEAKFGIVPYPGTLNIQVALKERPKLRLLDVLPCDYLEGFQEQDRSYGRVKCFRATLNNTIDCILVRPEVGGHADVVELIADEGLRESQELDDGMWVSIEVEA
jgi:riboflavin kinase